MLDNTEKFDATKAAKTLWHKGFAFYRIDGALAADARAAYVKFLERRLAHGDAESWRFTRPGEEADHPDLGLEKFDGTERDVVSGKRKDCKARFHFDCSLRRRLDEAGVMLTHEDEEFLELNLRLMDLLSQRSLQVAAALDEEFALECAAEVWRCQDKVSPYATTTLRGLHYPASEQPGGATAHPDRSFLTNHAGDEGGELQALVGCDWESISPPAGRAVVFLGVKALLVTRGRKGPLWHRSVTNPGQTRAAYVHFGHVRVSDYVVDDAVRAIADFEERFRAQLRAGSYRWQVD